MIRFCVALETTGPSVRPEVQHAFQSWTERPDVIYLWDDHTVTILPLPGSEPAPAPDGDDWREFCAQALRPDAAV